MERTGLIAVTGATGRQGGAVARLLAARGRRVRALTRRPQSPEAIALAAMGIELMPCDLGDGDAIRAALIGVDGLFLTTTPYEGGVGEEERQAVLAIDAALRSGVEQLIYASVASADRPTGVAHFESKRRIEQRLADVPFRALTILRPAFFMEMLLSPRFRRMLQLGRIEWILADETPLAMVSVDDIAMFVLRAFEQPAAMHGRRIDLAGDQPSAAGLAATLSQALGRTIAYRQIRMSEVADDAMPRLITQRWLEEAGWRIDTAALAALYPITLTDIAHWARSNRAALLEPV